MTESITVKKPFDAHLHLRRGSVLRAVAPISARKFSRAIVMPNTEPPIDTIDAADAYRKEILKALPKHSPFEPLMTLYLTGNLSQSAIAAAASGKGPRIAGVKYYPYGATTNSQWGYRDILEAKDVLTEMERAGIPLLLHGEVHLNDRDEEEDPYEGEKLFITEVLPRLLERHTALKISLEHVSTALAAEFIEKHGAEGRLVATLTPHHLVYDRRQAFSGGYRSLLHCKPLVKRREDREALRALVKKGLPFIFAGTDSAPHPEAKKFSSCCAFGVFNAPVAVELYAQVFDELGALEKLESFLSINGPRFYGLEPSVETATLAREDWQITEPVETDEHVKLWSLCDAKYGIGGEVLRWRLSA